MTDEFEELREDFAEKQRQRDLRAMRKKWAKVRPISNEVLCRFTDPEPAKGEQKEVDVEVTIDGNVLRYGVGGQVRSDQEGRMVFDPNVKRLGYRGAVEKWALWKWHTARGTPVDERDNYQPEPDYQPPKFVWGESPAKLGRPRKELAA